VIFEKNWGTENEQKKIMARIIVPLNRPQNQLHPGQRQKLDKVPAASLDADDPLDDDESDSESDEDESDSESDEDDTAVLLAKDSEE